MIAKLQRVITETKGEFQVSRLPNNEELMSKINEIINVVNKLDAEQTLHRPLRSNPFRSTTFE